jgi:nucleoside-diphosphate-sugar epimerase
MGRLFVYGYGFTGEALRRRLAPAGWTVLGTSRDPARRAAAQGWTAVDPEDARALAAALDGADAVLIAAPPTPEGCPGLRALVPVMARLGAFPDWLGYLSTTGVYGDHGGGWVFESTPLAARSPEGARRVAAERDWLEVGRGMGLTVTVHRLPGIYGPGRSAFDRLRAGTARRLERPGQVFSRVHVDDLAAGLAASIGRPRPGAVYNLCDDAPASAAEVTAHAAELLGVPPPPLEPYTPGRLTPAAERFYGESKRCSNALVKAELGWRPAYPTYREGLQAVLAAGG